MAFSLDKALMYGLTDMIFVLRVENKSTFIYEFLNQAAMNERGFSQDVLGKSIQEVLPNEEGEILNTHYTKVVDSGSAVFYQDSYLDSSGENHDAETQLMPLFNEENQCYQIVATVKDISKQKQAQAKAETLYNRLRENKLRYKSLFDNNSDAIISTDLEGHITNGNLAVKSVIGYDSEELIGCRLDPLIVHEDIKLVQELFIHALNGETESSQVALRDKAGNRVEIILRVIPVIVENEVTGIYGVLKDVTDTVASTKELQQSEERFKIIAENMDSLLTLLDHKGEIVYASPSYKKILGFNHHEFMGKLFLHNVSPADSSRLHKVVFQSIRNGEPFSVQFRQYNKKGELIWCEANGSPVFDTNHVMKHMVMLTRDITLQKEYEENLKYFAHHDILTGLPNRLLFNEQFKKELTAYKENKDGLALIMMDIDDFKIINDQLGHDIGDKVIEEFGKRVSQSIRHQDMVARLGGDEFVILLPSIGTAESAITIAKSIHQSIQGPWDIDGIPLEVTTSMGIAVATLEITSISLLKHADIALYEAKHRGKNYFVLREVGKQRMLYQNETV